MVLSLVIGVSSLYGISLGISKINSKWPTQRKFKNENKGICNESVNEGTRFRKAFIFIFGLIVVQGNLNMKAYTNNKKVKITLYREHS